MISMDLMNIEMAAIEGGNINEQDPRGGFIKFYVNPVNDSGLTACMTLLPDTNAIFEKLVTAEGFRAGAEGYKEKSSKRYKHNIKKINNALNVVDKLEGKTFQLNVNNKTKSGLIAEEVNRIIPHIVGKDDHRRPENIEYNSLIPYLIESIKELKKQNEFLAYEMGQMKQKYT